MYLSWDYVEQTFTRWCFQVFNANKCIQQLQQFAFLHEEYLKINPFSKTSYSTKGDWTKVTRRRWRRLKFKCVIMYHLHYYIHSKTIIMIWKLTSNFCIKKEKTSLMFSLRAADISFFLLEGRSDSKMWISSVRRLNISKTSSTWESWKR